MPILFQRAGNASDSARMLEVHTLNWRLTMTALFLTGAATWLAFVLHRVVFTWLVAPEYRTISWLLPGMVLAGGLFATGQCAAISLLSGTETRSLLALKIVTAIVGVLLNMLGAARWGVIGVVGAGIIFSMGYLLWTLYLVRSQYNQLTLTGIR
jgi:O-antigen/teichoic acid export membrane protein